MDLSLTLEYPIWFIAICLLLGLVYAAVLYYKNSFIHDPTKTQNRGFVALAFFRFVVVSLIAFLLLSPFIKTRYTETQKPIFLVLQDNSESISNAWNEADSLAYYNNLQALQKDLGEQFNVEVYSFGDELIDDWDGSNSAKQTNISDPLNQLINLYANQNVGGLILASDGIYNQGPNPIYTANKAKYPIYTVALGDTSTKKDLKIDQVYYSRIVYLEDRFKIETELVALNYKNAKTKLSIWDYSDRGDHVKLGEEEINFEKDVVLSEFVLTADKPGLRHLRLSLAPVADEHTKVNNYKDIFIDVLDGRQKILIAADSPHPDIAAIKHAIESNKNYEVDVAVASEVNKAKPEEYNLIILHQIPSRRSFGKTFVEKVKTAKVPSFYIVASNTFIKGLNDIQSAIQIKANSNSTNQASGLINEDFSLFTISEELTADLPKFPPLAVPFGEYTIAPNSSVFVNQRIGSVKTDFPLIVFNNAIDEKIGLLIGDGIWRWRLYNYLQTGSHKVFNELITKVVQYMSVKEDKRQFRVTLTKNVFNESETINLTGELYNESYELINYPEVSLVIEDEAGKEYPYQFDKRGNAYMLDLNNFSVGNYTFKARVDLSGKGLTYTGRFTITPLQIEAFNSKANHQLLYQISEKTGGKSITPSQLPQLAKELSNNPELKATLIENFKTRPLIDLKWLFVVIISFLSIEWFVRKYQGGY